MRLLACLVVVLGVSALLPASLASAQHGAPLHHAARVVSHKMHRAGHTMRAAGHHARAKMRHARHRMRAHIRHHS